MMKDDICVWFERIVGTIVLVVLYIICYIYG